MDVAGVIYEIDPSRAEQGARRAIAALDGLEKRTDAFIAKAKTLQQTLNNALSFSGLRGGGGSGATGQATQNLNNVAAAQKKAADEALKHAQALARLKQVQGDTAGAIKILAAALNGSAASTQQVIRAQTQLARLQNQQGFRRFASTVREAGESLQQTGYFLTGLSTSLIAVGSAAVKSAVDIDKNVNVLKSLLGSADAAERRLKQLTALSQATPGLTTGLAATLDAQLRVAGATEKAINRVLPAIGKLNDVSNLQDPQRFAQNLIQLVTQDFERIDLKELVGQSPLAGELIKQVFNVDSATNAKAIRESARKLGITTVDSFFDALSAAAEQNQKLAGITESLSTRFAKLADRVTIALRPLGVAIVDSLEPIVSRGVEILERLGKAFSDLPSGVKTAVVVFGALAAAIGPAVIGLGAIIQAAGAFANLAPLFASGGALAGIGAFLASLLPAAPIILGVATALGVAAVAWASYESAADRGVKVTADGAKGQLAQIEALKEIKLQAAALYVGRGKLNDVLVQLEPNTRAYIESIADEKTRTVELNRVIAEQIKLKQQKLAADVADTGAAAAKTQEELSRQQKLLEGLKVASAEAAKLQQAGITGSTLQTKIGQSLTGQFGSTVGGQIAEKLREGRSAAESFGSAIVDTTGKVGGLRNAEIQFGATINALFEANKRLTVDGFIEQQRAIGTSETAISAAVKAYEAFKQQQLQAANAASGTTAFIGQQVNAVDNLRAALEGLNKTANATVDQRIRDIALTSRNAAEAKAKLKQNVKLDDDFAFALQEKNRVAANLTALNEATNPSLSRVRSGGGSKSKEASELEQLQKQLREINKDIASFSNVKSPEFNLRIQLEDARRFKGELERIVTLRRELNEPLKAPLPTTKEGAQREIERLESLKKLNETIAKIDVFGPLAESAQKSQEAFAAQIQQLDKLISDSLPQTEAATVSAAIAQNEFFQSLLKTNPALAEYYRQQAAAADATIRTADAAKQFAQLQDELAGRLERFQNLSNEQALSLQLQAESYKNLSDAQRQQLLDLARQIDEQEQIKAQTEELRQQAEESQRAFDAFYGRVTDLFSTLYERGPKAFFDQMLSTLKRTLAQMAAELTTSAIFRLLGFKGAGGGGNGGGGFLGSLFGGGGGNSGGGGGGGLLSRFLGGGGGDGSGGGGGLLGRLFGGGGNGGGSSFSNPLPSTLGGGVFQNLFGGSKAGAGNFLTGGFAGGNPAQSAISKATGGGAGLLGKVPGLGFLGKLPVLGSLFGGGGAGLAGAAAGAGGTGAFAGATAGASAGGGSLFASLGALFSNPITAVVAGAVIGGIFLFKSLRNRTEKALRKLIRSEYEVDVKSMQVLKQVKDLGDQAFKGQGGAKKNQLQTIKLPEAKQLIADYAVQTGQNNSKLVREIELQRELQDPTSSQNRFRRFATGGRFTAGPAIVGDGGRPEVVVFGGSGEVFPSIREFEKQLLEALQSSKVLGGIFGGVRQQLISQLQNRAQSAAPQTERFAAGRMDRAIAAVGRAVGQLAEQVSRLEAAPADSVIQKVASDKPEIFTEATDRGLAAGGQRVNSFQQRLGLA